ncbi:hypothetical protein SAMN05444320_104453 [Streptoalloteichus hindustanus]|uniref:Transcriptional regulator, TetR family n=1 Tax=Streptoalloteichus hindustanus TaxID=2017 RepID=A0A1M5DHE3_STRHI|nr:hypothetical protein SAMN05444320_104453 [Streptoalloteichus hindustanus]
MTPTRTWRNRVSPPHLPLPVRGRPLTRPGRDPRVDRHEEQGRHHHAQHEQHHASATQERERAARHRLIVATARELAEQIEYSQPVLSSHFRGKSAIVGVVALEGSPS